MKTMYNENHVSCMILIASLNRPLLSQRILNDIAKYISPIYDSLKIDLSVCYYGQNYNESDWESILSSVNQNSPYANLKIYLTNQESNKTIGLARKKAVNWAIHTVKHVPNIIVLMDDDSMFFADMAVSTNWRILTQMFLEENLLTASLRISSSNTFNVLPFIEHYNPYVPILGKMMWINGQTLVDIVNKKGFDKLELGEDVAINFECFKLDPIKCISAYGFGSFLHLSLEDCLISPLSFELKVELDKYGYAALLRKNKDKDSTFKINRTGFTPAIWELEQNPNVKSYVSKNHLLSDENCLDKEAITRYMFSCLSENEQELCRKMKMDFQFVSAKFAREFDSKYSHYSNRYQGYIGFCDVQDEKSEKLL